MNNELVKSNIRAQKELQEAEKKTRELVQRVSHLEKELSLHEAQSEKYQNERDGEKVSVWVKKKKKVGKKENSIGYSPHLRKRPNY